MMGEDRAQKNLDSEKACMVSIPGLATRQMSDNPVLAITIQSTLNASDELHVPSPSDKECRAIEQAL